MNLAQFKRRLSDTVNNGGTVDFHYKQLTTFAVGHPGRIKYPEGQLQERNEPGSKISRVQSNSFARLNLEGRESWIDFGKASDWQFIGDNTAINTGASYKGTDHECVCSITYKFNQ